MDFDKEIPIKVKWLIIGGIVFVLPMIALFISQF